MSGIDLSVVIPAYNEEASIEATVREVTAYLSSLGLSHEIVVVDDGSDDSTLAVVRALCDELPSLRICNYSPNRGKGYAVRTGVLAAAGERILFTDADHSTPIQELPALARALDAGCGVAVGSRAVPGAVRTVHQPGYRELGGKALNLAVQLFAVPSVKDTQCGFKLFTRQAARSIFPLCFIDRFSFDVEVLYLARRLGYGMAELPVHWAHHPRSRVRPLSDGLRMLADIVRIRLHRYPLPEPGSAR